MISPHLLWIYNQAFTISLFVVDSIVLLIGLVAIGYTLVLQNEEGEWRVTHSMVLVCPLPILLRICYLAAHFTLQEGPYLSQSLTDVDMQHPTLLVFSTMPAYLLLALYSLLIIFWIGLYYREKRVRSYWLANWKWLCFSFNAIIASIWAGFMIAIPLISSIQIRREVTAAEALFEVLVSLLLAGFFACYVPLLIRQLGQKSLEATPIPQAVRSLQQIRNRITAAAIICSIALVLRSLIVILRLTVLLTQPLGNLIANMIEYLLCETLPICVILFFIIMPEDLRHVVPSLANPFRRISQHIRSGKKYTADVQVATSDDFVGADFSSTPYILKVSSDESTGWESDNTENSQFNPF